jgi:hypothetical protein
MALEGEYYVNISLLPLVIHEMKDQLGICEGAENPNTQQHLLDLLGKMQEDFHEHWGDTLSYSSTTIQSSRRCHKGIP